MCDQGVSRWQGGPRGRLKWLDTVFLCPSPRTTPSQCPSTRRILGLISPMWVSGTISSNARTRTSATIKVGICSMFQEEATQQLTMLSNNSHLHRRQHLPYLHLRPSQINRIGLRQRSERPLGLAKRRRPRPLHAQLDRYTRNNMGLSLRRRYRLACQPGLYGR